MTFVFAASLLRLVWNQDNVSQWISISTRGVFFQLASIIKIQLIVLVWYKGDLAIISSNVTCSCQNIAEKLLSLALNNNHWLTQTPTNRVGLIHNWYHHLIKCNLFLPKSSWKITNCGLSTITDTNCWQFYNVRYIYPLVFCCCWIITVLACYFNQIWIYFIYIYIYIYAFYLSFHNLSLFSTFPTVKKKEQS